MILLLMSFASHSKASLAILFSTDVPITKVINASYTSNSAYQSRPKPWAGFQKVLQVQKRVEMTKKERENPTKHKHNAEELDKLHI